MNKDGFWIGRGDISIYEDSEVNKRTAHEGNHRYSSGWLESGCVRFKRSGWRARWGHLMKDPNIIAKVQCLPYNLAGLSSSRVKDDWKSDERLGPSPQKTHRHMCVHTHTVEHFLPLQGCSKIHPWIHSFIHSVFIEGIRGQEPRAVLGGGDGAVTRWIVSPQKDTL